MLSLIGGEYDEMTSLPGMLWLVAKLADHADDLWSGEHSALPAVIKWQSE